MTLFAQEALNVPNDSTLPFPPQAPDPVGMESAQVLLREVMPRDDLSVSAGTSTPSTLTGDPLRIVHDLDERIARLEYLMEEYKSTIQADNGMCQMEKDDYLHEYKIMFAEHEDLVALLEDA